MRVTVIAFILALLPNLAVVADEPVEVRYGFVVAKERLREGNAAPKGAVIGGLVGLATASGKSGSTKVKRTAGGALLGGLIANEVDKADDRWVYTVRFPGGGERQIVMNDGRLSLGDCAAVEEGLRETRVHYASDYYCRARSVDEIAAERRGDDPCTEAKRRLLDATDPEEIEVLERKVQLICEG